MIFVTVGTSSWDFSRLLKEMDNIAGKIDEEVIMQISNIKYKPRNAKYFRFNSKEEIERLYKNARVVVIHAGVGSIISALRHSKVIIVVPRRKEYGELFDNHQLDIAKELERDSIIKVVWDLEKLETILKNSENCSPYSPKNNKLIYELRYFINNIYKSD